MAVATASADPIGDKQAEARQIIQQIDALGVKLDKASEAYDGATYRLRQIRASLRENQHELAVAHHDVEVASNRLAIGLRAIYMTQDSSSTVAILLGASSLTDAMNALDVQKRISQQTAELLQTVIRFRAKVERVRARLQHNRAAQEKVVAARAAAKARIVRGLAEQHRLLASVQQQISELKLEEALRQARLAAAAAARLAQERVLEEQALREQVVGATTEVPGAAGYPPVTVVPPSQVGARVVQIAEQYLGYPYIWGAEGPDAFDCSGLVTYVFAQVGISLPHFAAAQWNYGTYVSIDQLQPGDLVFFAALDHVGIYIGNGEYIEAPHPGGVVQITSLSDPWAAANYYGAKRIT
ncbi:MAG TPA: NlpC/P60 family protein [Gaiellaceae bacterium]|nr:NlpC/P60 family protein [Gaiellaceae bacterium]